MHCIVFFAVAVGACLAYYYEDYDTSMNLIPREEPRRDDGIRMLECPTCPEKGFVRNDEPCFEDEVTKRKFKLCHVNDTYINELCGGRVDCYMKPGERCTESMSRNIYGKRCMAGYVCIRGYCSIGGGDRIQSFGDPYIENSISRRALWLRRFRRGSA